MPKIDIGRWMGSILYLVYEFFFDDMDEELFKMMGLVAFTTFWIFFSVGLGLGAPKWLAVGGALAVPIAALTLVRLTRREHADSILGLAQQARVGNEDGDHRIEPK